MLHMLHRAGELGDRLQVSVYAVGGFVRDIMLSRPAVEFDDVDLVVEGDGIAFAKALAQELGGRVREHRGRTLRGRGIRKRRGAYRFRQARSFPDRRKA